MDKYEKIARKGTAKGISKYIFFYYFSSNKYNRDYVKCVSTFSSIYILESMIADCDHKIRSLSMERHRREEFHAVIGEC